MISDAAINTSLFSLWKKLTSVLTIQCYCSPYLPTIQLKLDKSKPSLSFQCAPGIVLSSDEDTKVLVFGSVAIDFACDYKPQSEGAISQEGSKSSLITPQMHTSNVAAVTTSLGGVGHNVALAIHRAGSLPTSVKLCSMIADDLYVLSWRFVNTLTFSDLGRLSYRL